MRALPLLVRKGCLLDVVPSVESRVRYVDHIHEQGAAFFDSSCQRDLEGIVAKWAHGTSQEGERTSWLKVKNPAYSQVEDRHELFRGSPQVNTLSERMAARARAGVNRRPTSSRAASDVSIISPDRACRLVHAPRVCPRRF